MQRTFPAFAFIATFGLVAAPQLGQCGAVGGTCRSASTRAQTVHMKAGCSFVVNAVFR